MTDFEQNNTEARLNADIVVRLESWKSSPLIDLSFAELRRADKVALGAERHVDFARMFGLAYYSVSDSLAAHPADP